MKNIKNVNQKESKKKEINNIKLKENISSSDNSEDEILNKNYSVHFPKEKSNDDIIKLYEEFHLKEAKEKEIENEKSYFLENKIEREVEKLLIDIYNYRYNNINNIKRNLNSRYINEIKKWIGGTKKSNHMKIFSVLIQKLHSLIDYIKRKINFKKIEIKELTKIKNSIKICAKDIEEIFDVVFDGIGKPGIENIILNLFRDKILSETKNYLKENEYNELSKNTKDNKLAQKRIELEKGFTIKYNNFNKDTHDLDNNSNNKNNSNNNINNNNSINNNNNINNNKIVQNTNKNIINGIITSNSLLKGYSEVKKYENIDDLVDYINEEDKKKKSKKKKKKVKKIKIQMKI